MQAETVESELSRRVAALSPARRAILQRLMSSATETSVAEEIPLQERGSRCDFPLSSAQERMWFNHQWSPAEPLYNESFGLTVRGPLNLDLLGRGFELVMARHEIFSTTFHSEQGRLFQRIGSGPAPKLKVSDLRGLSHEEREKAFERESHNLLRKAFDLEKGPLFRAGAWRIDDEQTRLIFAMHHIIFDGRSGGIFLGELLSAYAALADGQRPELPPVGAQYVDFAVWEQFQFDSSAELEQQAEYWRNQLANAPEPPSLPVDRHIADNQVHAAGREVFVCPPAAAAALKALANDSGATLFMALLAIFKLLLARYSGQEDILVGVPTTNRNHDALRNMVGVFINTAILRTDLSGDVSFRELLARVRKTTLGAQANQELPLQRVLRLLDTPTDQGRSLLRVLFDLQNKSAPSAEIPGLSLEPLDIDNGRAKFDLVLAFEETDSELKGILDYDAEKFEAETARQLVRHYLALMEASVAQPNLPANRLPMLTVDEISQTTLRGLDTAGQPPPLAVAETIAHARQHPREVALADGNSSLTYGEMHARALRLVLHLREKGIAPAEHIALFLPAGLDLVVAQLAAMISGAAFMPIDPSYPTARIEFMLQDSGARFAIVNEQTCALLPDPAMAIQPDRDCPPLVTHENPSEIRLPSGDDPAYLIYTSGSTGQPKGVSVSHAALANLIAWHQRAFEISRQDRASQIASVAFDASIWEIWPYLASGASVHFVPRELATDPAVLRDWIVKQKITVAFAPTPMAEELIALRWPSRSKLRILLTGGDRLRKNPPAGLPFAFVNNYGPTENAVVATSGLTAPSASTDPPSIGRPIDNVWARIVDRNLEPVPRGGIGELVIGGRSLALLYRNRPELTAEKFVALDNGERAYRTGDLCHLRRDGEIDFIGRADTQIKLRGYRIELGEIENALLDLPDVRNAATAVREFPNGQKGIVAYVAVKDRALTPENLRTQLAGRLAGYMIPASFVLVDSLPTSASGKIDRDKLPPLSAQAASSRSRIPPRTDTEREIAAIWRDLLHVESIGIQDDFFALGGDSLLATRLAARIRETFSAELPLSRMVETPTVEALARFIEGARRAHPGADQIPDNVILLRAASETGAPPLFLAPPASGSPACYLGLAHALPGAGAVYGLEAPGLTNGTPLASVVEQARLYVAATNRVYPQGSCFLGGWSLGGAVAFEMARQLQAAGRDVGCLALIDAGLPENGRLPGGASMLTPLWWAISYPFAERVPLNYRTFRMLAQWMGIPLPESPRDVWRRGFAGGIRFAASLAANAWRSLRVFRANVRAFRTYQPEFFDGNIILFRTAQGAQLENRADAVRHGLGQWCRHVEIDEAPGSHMTLMLDPKINSVFAASLGATLSAAVQNKNESEEREFHATSSF